MSTSFWVKRLLVVLPRLTALALTSLALAGEAHAQYAGEETRAIKALSDAEIADLLAGKGMGFAKAAELNGYPGPAHVLELASQLRLSEEQVRQTRAVHARMEADAKSAGTLLVDAERELNELFRGRSATPERVAESLRKVAAAQAKVREAHLNAHIEQTRLLSQEQVAEYNELRGYTGSAEHSGPHHGHADHHGGTRSIR